MNPLAIRADAVNIIAPLIPSPCRGWPVRVTGASPLSHRRAVYKIARYFRREFQYDFVQFHETERGGYVAFLWPHPEAASLPEGFRVACVGATCFRHREDGWAMQWVWLHPFWRRRGLLSGAWPRFVKEFGAFTP